MQGSATLASGLTCSCAGTLATPPPTVKGALATNTSHLPLYLVGDPATTGTTQGKYTISQLASLPSAEPGTPTMPAPDSATAKNKKPQAPRASAAAATNAIIGGVKLVQYRDSRFDGVPAGALTLDRLTPATIVPGTLAVVENPSDTPLADTKPPQQYVATVALGTVGAVLVPRYLGATDSDTVPIVWQQVAAGPTAATSGSSPADNGIVLSSAAQALLDIQKLLCFYSEGWLPRTTIQLSQHGVKKDGVLGAHDNLTSGTDNAPALLAVRQQFATATRFRQQPALTLVLPAGGVVSYSQNNWADKYRDFVLDLNGSTLRPVYGGNDNFLQCTLRNAELLQTNGDSYVGTKTYMTGVRFHTAPIGSTSLRVVDPRQLDPALFFPGAWVKLYSRERVLGENAYPPATDDEAVHLDTVDYTTGRVTFHPATTYEHREDWPENAQTAGGGSGRARMISLDHPERPYCAYAEFRNGTMLSSSQRAPGAIAFRANRVVYDNITTRQGGTATETLEETLFLNCNLDGEFEDDKGNGKVTRVNTRVGGLISNGNGCPSSTMHGGRSAKSIQLAAKRVEILNAECWASAYHTDRGTRLHEADPAVASYVGFHLTRQYIVGRLRLGATNKTTAYLDPALYEEYTVRAVRAGRIAVEWDGSGNRQMLLFWRGVTIGTPIYTVDGAKGGRVTAFEFVPIGDGTRGTFYLTIGGVTPAVGETYIFSNVLNVIDYGGHTVLTPRHPARLWGFDNLRWKGNKGGTPNAPGPLTLTKADLRFRNGGTIAYFRLCGKPRRITITARTAANGRLLVVGTNKAQTVGVELVNFDLAVTGTRYASAGSASKGVSMTNAKQTGRNQYRPAGFGVFAHTMGIVFDGLSYAQIPADLTITIDTDYF